MLGKRSFPTSYSHIEWGIPQRKKGTDKSDSIADYYAQECAFAFQKPLVSAVVTDKTKQVHCATSTPEIFEY